MELPDYCVQASVTVTVTAVPRASERIMIHRASVALRNSDEISIPAKKSCQALWYQGRHKALRARSDVSMAQTLSDFFVSTKRVCKTALKLPLGHSPVVPAKAFPCASGTTPSTVRTSTRSFSLVGGGNTGTPIGTSGPAVLSWPWAAGRHFPNSNHSLAVNIPVTCGPCSPSAIWNIRRFDKGDLCPEYAANFSRPDPGRRLIMSVTSR